MSDPNSSILIRPGSSKDAATLAAFNVAMAWETEKMRLDPPVVEAGVRAVLEDPAKGQYFVAEIEGKLVGCTMITHEWSDWRNGDMWWIQSVYVHPESRRRGVFRALYLHVHKVAREVNVRCIRLYVEKHNETGKATYLKLGMHLTEYDVMEENL